MGAPVDFVSTHNYPTGNRSDGSGCPQGEAWVPDCFRDDVLRARKTIPSSIPFILSEYNVQVGEGMAMSDTTTTGRVAELGGNEPPFQHDDPGAAAFVMRVVPQLAPELDGLSYWTFSDVFEENSLPRTEYHPLGQSHYGQPHYGAMTLHGVPKPVWRAFQLLHTNAGSHSVPTVVNNTASIPLVSAATTLNVTSVSDSNGRPTSSKAVAGSARLFLSHWDASGSAANHSAIMVNVTVLGAARRIAAASRRPTSVMPPSTAHSFDGRDDALLPSSVTVWMIDEQCSANLLWQQMGSPAVPTSEQLQQLIERSELSPKTVPVVWPSDGTAEIHLRLDPNTAAVVEIGAVQDGRVHV